MDTLLHELLHLWQRYQGTPSGYWLHNVEFRRKALECGLVVTGQGSSAGRTQVFLEILRKHDINVSSAATPRAPRWGSRRDAAKTKMKKWVCGCRPRPMVVRCARELHATCEDCGERFAEA
jgi:hypothetical protein